MGRGVYFEPKQKQKDVRWPTANRLFTWPALQFITVRVVTNQLDLCYVRIGWTTIKLNTSRNAYELLNSRLAEGLLTLFSKLKWSDSQSLTTQYVIASSNAPTGPTSCLHAAPIIKCRLAGESLFSDNYRLPIVCGGYETHCSNHTNSCATFYCIRHSAADRRQCTYTCDKWAE